MVEKEEEIGTFYIRLFGEISIEYKGVKADFTRSSSQKYVQLLLILLLEQGRGIPKERLSSLLFSESDVAAPGLRLNDLIYYLRKQMVKRGLPDKRYVIVQDKRCYWNMEIPCSIDLVRFKQLAAEAQRETGARACALALQAVNLVQGYFSIYNQTASWAVLIENRVESLYNACMKCIDQWLREQQDYAALYRIYTQADICRPKFDWSLRRIELLLQTGHPEEAEKLYQTTLRKVERDKEPQQAGRLLELEPYFSKNPLRGGWNCRGMRCEIRL